MFLSNDSDKSLHNFIVYSEIVNRGVVVVKKWLVILTCVCGLTLFGCSNEDDIFNEQQMYVIHDVDDLVEILNNKTTFPIKGARDIRYTYSNQTEDIMVSFDLDKTLSDSKYFESIEMIEKTRDVIINNILTIEQNQLNFSDESVFISVELYDKDITMSNRIISIFEN